MKLLFNLSFHTKMGENLQLVILETGKTQKKYPMTYSDNGIWITELDFYDKNIHYKYQVTNNEGMVLNEELKGHNLNFPHNIKEYKIFDTWNKKNYPENYLNNKILQNKLSGFKPEKESLLKKHTHLFRIEAPLYRQNWRMVILGNVNALGNWEYLKTHPMKQTSFGIWEAAVTIPENNFIQYKYGIMDETSGNIINIETGENRYAFPNTDNNILHIKSDHFYGFKSHEMYHAAGVAVPIFALRSEKGFGVGEFSDLKELANWAKETNLGMIQILPINDTTANYTWTDSYPYAAISVYALHPQYLSIENLEFSLEHKLQKEFEIKKQELNNLKLIDYEKVISQKWKFINSIFKNNKEKILKDRNFKKFIKANQSWLHPYAAFCVLRDKYKTPNFNNWKTHKNYIAGKIAPIFKDKHRDFEKAMIHCWVQYQLHLQLKDAVDYLHQLGISLKGDLPIGIYRYSVEAWKEPELFGMGFQAGAPPDQFTESGQNWEFPTYNWEAMKKDGYIWWKNRFKALEQYFDAMRIDHILGFFRIWRMPISATQGILGYFHPAVPVTLEEFEARNIQFNKERFCNPFINDQILHDYFGNDKERIQNKYLISNEDGTYQLKDEFNTQRKLKDYFAKNEDAHSEQLISLCANVLFLEEKREGETIYHPRFNLQNTTSYQYLSEWERKALYDLSLDYFYKRQDEIWTKSAMEKLPIILNSTKMLICGEDLGLVPDCVPEVMDALAITALKIQRMPSENIPFYNPRNASYLNVVTTSSHDTSTLRQWWNEDRNLTQKYFNQQLQQWGTAPGDLEPELAEMIMKQHLYNNAMLAIFPIQEFFAINPELRNNQIEHERINNPAIFPYYWRYRMHLNLNELNKAKQFNQKIAGWVVDSNRS